MPILDTTPDFLAWWDRARRLPPSDRARSWHEQYEAPHRDHFATYWGTRGQPDDLPAALTRYPAIAAALPARAAAVRRETEALAPPLAAAFGQPTGALPWVLLVGLFTSDGWVDIDRTPPVCYCALEALQNPDLASVLLAHEAAHGCHALANPAFMGESWTIGHALFAEGLAVVASTVAVPGHPAGTYLWPGREETNDGEPVGRWAGECTARWLELRSTALRDLPETGPDTYAAWFLGGRRQPRWPIRAGYFLGARLVATMARSHSLAELARWPADRVLAEVERTLETAEGPDSDPSPWRAAE